MEVAGVNVQCVLFKMCESSIFTIIISGYRPCLYAYLVDKGTEALEVPSAGSQS